MLGYLQEKRYLTSCIMPRGIEERASVSSLQSVNAVVVKR